MKYLVLFALIASAYAGNLLNADGTYTFSYQDGLSARSELRSGDGLVRGAYHYYDTDGKLQRVEYTSGAGIGFRVAATNLPVADNRLPVAPEPTPEVLRATNEHLAAWHREYNRLPHFTPEPEPVIFIRHLPVHRPFELPSPHSLHLQDTPEVAAAKVEHFQAHAKQRALVGLA